MKKHSAISQTQSQTLEHARYGQVRDIAKQRRNLLQNPRNALQEATRERPPPKHLSPRDFQIELFKRAQEQNTIAVLDTGSGKTFIAAMLLKEHILGELAARELHARELLRQREPNDPTVPHRPRKLAFFLVDKVALAMQQSEFLQSSCPGEIGFLYGALGVDNYSKTQWIDIYDKHHAIVMTAQILVTCLARGFISMSEISLLIFDECHHAASNHPFALILRVYHEAKHDDRPRIFGMTASPVSSRKTPLTVIEKLEATMDARVCTPSLSSSLSSLVVRPEEIILRYDTMVPEDFGMEVDTYSLRKGASFNKSFKKLVASAEYVTTELGPWARERCWKMLVQDATDKSEAKSIYKEREGENLQETKDMLLDATKIVDQREDEVIQDPVLSPKVSLMLELLNEIYSGAEKRGEPIPVVLLFCERRVTAYLLLSLVAEIVKDKMHPNIKPSIFIGQGGADDAGVSMLIRRQVFVVDSFRRGDFNLLFATSVAEEGIDIPACNYVIRFDAFSNVAQYIQSRGRARHPGSRFIMFLENNAPKAEQALLDVKVAEARIREVCSQLPEDRVVSGVDVEMGNLDDQEDDASLVAHHFEGQANPLPEFAALNVVSAFCNSLGTNDFVIMAPTYKVSGSGIQWQGSCTLPAICGIPPVTGLVRKSRRSAKSSAAHAAVAALVQRKLVDEYYNPFKPEVNEEVDTNDEALLFRSRDQWPIRKPRLWQPRVAERFFVARVTTDRADGHYAPLLFITKDAPMPQLPLVEFSHEGRAFRMQVLILEGSITSTSERLAVMIQFTRRLLRFSIHKHFIADDPGDYPWFIGLDTGTGTLEAEAAISWQDMEHCAIDRSEQLNPALSRYNLHDALVREVLHNADYQFCGFDASMTADSKIPEHDARFDASAPDTTLREFYTTIEPDQQIVEGQKVIHARRLYKGFNYLAPPASRKRSADEMESTGKKIRKRDVYFLPQFCKLVNMKASVVLMGRLLPSLTLRLETLLLADEVNKQLGTSIRLDLLATAITARQANHGHDYERLEFLGDAFLKQIATVAVYLKFPHHPEGLLTSARTAIISNTNLRKLSIKLGFPAVMRTVPMSRPKWRYTNKVVEPQVLSPVETTHRLGFKQVADVVESILGAAFKSGGFDLGLQAAVAMGIEMFGINSWEAARALYSASPPPFLQRARTVDGEQQVTSIFGYQFANNGLLEQALRHGSCHIDADDPVPSYERLELLGDAVLDIEAASLVYDRYPSYGPDQLSNLKSYIVCNKTLGEVCEVIGLQKYLKQFNGGVLLALAEYATRARFQRQRKQKNGTKAEDDIASIVAPKFMSDMIESVIGAIFVDCGFRNEPINRILHNVLLPTLDLDAAASIKAPKPAMTLLSEYFQKYPCNAAELHRDVDKDETALNAHIAVRGQHTEQKSKLTLLIHGKQLLQIVEQSLAMAKLALANEALTLLRDNQWMKQVCDCAEKTLAKKLAAADPMDIEKLGESSADEADE
ncbi:hypothetical protein BCR37DRAFT_112367 [Protomyces lactucae-debilis]|uniref:Dicer-like protein 1 n=1 Tax=Protomyces lactucae-debilis TaxID=2754530 RepID=A0A1Y2F2P3_PROLT|nr:uncharacterized protein BCR37DRAFT_112367 [Protomyces lactucae-debilis]ORY78132.1 hypothetical protein BCR37DRAFT_112367 [Protomyces lactucae-debilis]